MNESDLAGLAFGVVALAIFGFLIISAVLLIRKSNKRAQQSEETVGQIMRRLPQDKQMLFMMQYNSVKKNPTTAVLLSLFLGGLGIHKFYLGQTAWGILYLLFAWTYIPAIIGFLEAFVIAGRVGDYNKKKAMEIAAML